MRVERELDGLRGEREQLRRELESSRRLQSLGQLAGTTAHELNNLLAVILIFDRFIADAVDGALGGEHRQLSRLREDVAEIERAAERGKRLTRNLLTFGRRAVDPPAVVDVNGLIAGIERLLALALGHQVQLKLALQSDTAAALAGAAELEQVLLNLAINARDAMPDGGEWLIETSNVSIGSGDARRRPTLSPGPHVRLRFTDTGFGMAGEVQRRALEPFFTTKPEDHGTGLGLSTVHEIVTRASGEIEIWSMPGFGTSITILLPTAT